MPLGQRQFGIAAGANEAPANTPAPDETPAGDFVLPLATLFVPCSYDEEVGQATEDGTGVATITFHTDGELVRKIERISVFTTSAATSAARVYLRAVSPENLVDSTANGNEDIADEVNPILWPKSTRLLIKWTGLSAGAVASTRIQYVGGYFATIPFGGSC